MTRAWRTALFGGLGVAIGFGVVLAGRWSLLLRNGRRLVERADRLPREYTVGSGRPVRMIVLGDSTAAGVGAGSLEATLPYRVASMTGRRIEVTNRAVSGACLADVSTHQLDARPLHVDWVLVSISANDATHGTDPSSFAADLDRLLSSLREVGRVVLSTTPDFRTTPALPAFLNRRFADRAALLTGIIRRIATRHPNVRLADLFEKGTLTVEQYAADGFHPNAEGYARWAPFFASALTGP